MFSLVWLYCMCYVCMYECMYVCIYLRMGIYICMYCIHTYICVPICMCMYIFMQVCFMCLCACIYRTIHIAMFFSVVDSNISTSVWYLDIFQLTNTSVNITCEDICCSVEYCDRSIVNQVEYYINRDNIKMYGSRYLQ